jgi:hypothetical protein
LISFLLLQSSMTNRISMSKLPSFKRFSKGPLMIFSHLYPGEFLHEPLDKNMHHHLSIRPDESLLLIYVISF